MNQREQMISEFLAEAHTNLDALDGAFKKLGDTPDNKIVVNEIFKIVHQIRGIAGFLEFSQLKEISLHGEIAVNSVLNDKRPYSPETSLALFGMVEAIREQIGEIENSGHEKDTDSSALIEELRALK